MTSSGVQTTGPATFDNLVTLSSGLKFPISALTGGSTTAMDSYGITTITATSAATDYVAPVVQVSARGVVVRPQKFRDCI